MSSFFSFAGEQLPSLLKASQVTLLLTSVSVTTGLVLGVIIALARVYGSKPAYWLTTIYIDIIRGTPLLVQLLIIYYTLPRIGLLLPSLPAAMLAFIMNTCAYQAEYIRGSIQSVESGQVLAARALGMSSLRTSLRVVVPQALRIAVPALSNEWILMLKVSALSFIVGVPELLATAKMIAFDTFRYVEAFVLCALIYAVLVFILAGLLRLLERKLRIPGLGATISERR